MNSKNVTIYSRYPLIASWLKKQVEDVGWKCELQVEGEINSGIALVDISGCEDIELLENCEKKEVSVVIFSRYTQSKLLRILYEQDVKGHLHGASDTNDFLESLKAASQGDEYFDENILTFILSSRYRDIYDSIVSLSQREKEIIDGIMEDLTNDEIAARFDLSVRTVNAHKRNILQKMKARSLVGVVKMMLTYTMRYD